MSQTNVVVKESKTIKLQDKTIWITEVLYQDGTKSQGIGFSKKESETNLGQTFAEVSLPSFISSPGSVNQPIKKFLVLNGGMKYLKANVPFDVYTCFIPIICANADNTKQVALACEDALSKQIFYIHAIGKTFVEALENCTKQMILEYFKNPEEIVEYPKINSWVNMYWKNQTLGSFEYFITK